MGKMMRHVSTLNTRYNLYRDGDNNIIEVMPSDDAPKGFQFFGYRVEKKRIVYEMPVEQFIAQANIVE